MNILNKIISFISLIFLLASCSQNKNEVVVYCSLDKIYSEPILKEFEKQTGLRVKAVYDMELTKTVGLVNRIIAESGHPQCDVFWNNEISRTIMLKNKEILQAYHSPNAADIPPEYKDTDGYWTGFAARARVIIYNKQKCSSQKLPNSIMDLAAEEWKGKAALAYPLFGTTATHAAALFSKYGTGWTVDFFKRVEENETGILDGNATVRDRVVSGDYWWGFTDTDDANGAIEDGKNVGVIYPDQKDGEMGMLVIPNTVALIRSCPHPENAKHLIDFILEKEVEEILAYSRAAQIPVRADVKIPEKVIRLDSVRQMKIDYLMICNRLDESAKILSEIFIK
jgi:iron(III) transport system substrate-binding protein